MTGQRFSHSTELRGEARHRSAKASGGEDLQVEKPVACWDCVSAAVARLDAQPIASFQQPVAGSPRATIASTYVKCTADEAIHIDLQDELAGRCDHIVTFESDHSPFLLMPGAVADVLEPLACR